MKLEEFCEKFKENVDRFKNYISNCQTHDGNEYDLTEGDWHDQILSFLSEQC